MVVTAAHSDDARVIALLCSSVAAARGETARPFGPVAWSERAARLSAAGLAPGALLGMSAAAVAAVLDADADLDADHAGAERVTRLLARSGQLAIELDRLAARGIGVVTLADEAYPAHLRDRLGREAPPLLFLAGDRSLLGAGGVAIVGSRDVDPAGAAFAEAVAADAARAGRVVVSGGARGVDQLAMRAALGAGGSVVGLLPEGIERRVREPETRAAIAGGVAVLASPYHPGAGFSAGAAMGRNKLIYALADVAVVVASAAETGGTWAGAVETLRGRWVPLFVRRADPMPDGNRRLIERGALPLDEPLAPMVPESWPGAAAEGAPSGIADAARADDVARAGDTALDRQPSLGLFD